MKMNLRTISSLSKGSFGHEIKPLKNKSAENLSTNNFSTESSESSLNEDNFLYSMVNPLLNDDCSTAEGSTAHLDKINTCLEDCMEESTNFEKCKICRDVFSVPKILICLHSFCKSCIFSISDGHKVTCPICQTDTLFKPEYGQVIDKLPVDVSILNYYEDVYKNSGTKIKCTNCRIKGKSSIVRCHKCCLFLCETCFSEHGRISTSEPHSLTYLTNVNGYRGQEFIQNCHHHTNVPATHFCTDCKYFICKSCVDVASPNCFSHFGHKTNTIQQFKDRFYSTLGQLNKDAKDCYSSVKNRIGAFQSNKECIANHISDLQDNVDQTFNSIVVFLKSRRFKIQQMLTEMNKKLVAEEGESFNGYYSMLSRIKGACGFLDKLTKFSNFSDVYHLLSFTEISTDCIVKGVLDQDSKERVLDRKAKIKTDIDDMTKKILTPYTTLLDNLIKLNQLESSETLDSSNHLNSWNINNTKMNMKLNLLSLAESQSLENFTNDGSTADREYDWNLSKNGRNDFYQHRPSSTTGYCRNNDFKCREKKDARFEDKCCAKKNDFLFPSQWNSNSDLDVGKNEIESFHKNIDYGFSNFKNFNKFNTPNEKSKNFGSNGNVSTTSNDTPTSVASISGYQSNYAIKSQIRRHKMIYHCKFGEFGVTEGHFTEPSGVATNMNNDIIVADTNNHRIQIFDREGCFKFQFGECGKRDGQLLYPNRVAVIKKTGDIVVTERSPTHQIQIYSQYGQFIRKFGADILQHPRGVAVDNRGRIIIVECKVMRVIIFDQDGKVLQKFNCNNHLEFPNGVVVNDKEEIFISDNRAHCVKVFNYNGEYLRKIGGEGLTNYPIGVGINKNSDIVVADNHNNFNITTFKQDGTLVSAFESKVKHAQCFDVALMEEGCIVLASKDYRLYVYNYVQNRPFSNSTCTKLTPRVRNEDFKNGPINYNNFYVPVQRNEACSSNNDMYASKFIFH